LQGASQRKRFDRRWIKRQFGYIKLGLRRQVKNTSQLVTLLALSNLWTARRHFMTTAEKVRL
jgi:transposase, IS5 family